ncbi:Multidrug resistance protein MdtF [termite gut metagenome]|uniref:Multidrug resistance protein MdtF n=1 Tax=termite gut metagenome TaxID=433724 RepID=A0A5J4P5L7_9ZZZZ
MSRRLESGENLTVGMDSTGLKVYGDGEWKVRKHFTLLRFIGASCFMDTLQQCRLIVLIDLVSKNAILLVNFANQMRRDQNMDTFDALAKFDYARPILMTSLAMVSGMLPISLHR